jgi:exodeoxyribonuclease VII small subunit
MNKKMSLQNDFEELNKLTEEFESGKIGLEESMPKFRRGLELARRIKKRLEEIENEIKEIKGEFHDLDESPLEIKEEDFETDSASDDQPPF